MDEKLIKMQDELGKYLFCQMCAAQQDLQNAMSEVKLAQAEGDEANVTYWSGVENRAVGAVEELKNLFEYMSRMF